MRQLVDNSSAPPKRGPFTRPKVGGLPAPVAALLLAVLGSAHVSSAQAGGNKPASSNTHSKGQKYVKTTKERIAHAYKRAAENRPKVGAYPYLAEALRQAGVLRYVYTLPSGQCIFYANDGKVVNQSEVVATGTLEVPSFDKEEFVKVLRRSQNGETTFPEFLKGSWESGVIRYEADLVARTVTYSGAEGEAYVEGYPAVELPE